MPAEIPRQAAQGMMVHCLYDKLVPIEELRSHPKNRNAHPPDQIQRLAKILKYQGWRYPVKISTRSGCVTSGHGRIEAARLNGWKTVPVNYQDYESDDQEYADVQADNAIASWAELDLAGINADIGDLGPDLDIDMLGIKDFVLEPAEKLDPLTDEDSVPEEVEPRTKLGDIYRLGKHRLMCGDSTSIDAIDSLMDGQSADMVFTDPPYGMFLDTDFSSMDGLSPSGKSFLGTKGGKVHRSVIGDNEDFKPELINTIFAAFPDCKEVFLFGADYYADLLPDRNEGSWVVWDKRTNEGATEEQADSADRLYGSNFELCWSKAKHKREIARVRNGIFGVKNETGNSKTVHPTQKPVQLIEWFFERWGERGDRLVDLFGGSGSTIIASEKTDRSCFMMELDPKYCDVIVARWEAYTGQKAELLNG